MKNSFDYIKGKLEAAEEYANEHRAWEREQIAEIMMEAMSFHDIYPDIWEMKVEAIIDSEDRPEEAE